MNKHTPLASLLLSIAAVACWSEGAEPLRIGLFQLDATPPVGSMLAYDVMERREATLQLKGIVLAGDVAGGEPPIVLVAVDWIGIGGAGHDHFREAIAKAVGTTPQRVAVHTLHQHDAPRYDLGAEQLMAAEGRGGRSFDVAWTRQFVAQVARESQAAAARLQSITHLGLGSAKVEKVASNRRILGADGKVAHIRWTATRDPQIRAFPEGTIDPLMRALVLYEDDQPRAALTYYATHPQSYYRTGTAHPDFPGMARDERQKATGVPHLHFNGAGGNIGAGKYNDGSPENRPRLAARMAAGMQAAVADAAQHRHSVQASDLSWATIPVVLPPAPHLDEASLLATLKDQSADDPQRNAAATNLAFLRRCRAKHPFDIACLTLGPARVLHMPGELFVEYQLQAAQLRPDRFVAMAAYGDYSPGYIGVAEAYGQGGYETSPRASRVAPQVEQALMDAVRKLLIKQP